MSNRLGLYLHFPWCVRKCPYCDFNSHPVRGDLDESGYLDALRRDAQGALEDVAPGQIDTVFYGGGTPSLFSPDTFAALGELFAPWLRDGAEITLEANPGTTEHHDWRAYRDAGITRLSIGAQSFDEFQLRTLGRIHAARDTEHAFEQARAGGFDNINLDLMYGLPGQTAEQGLADLERALRLAPEHLSWYQLTIEPKTEFARRPPLLASDATVERLETAGAERLADAGYARYEVSAYARPGRECRHNRNYWSFGDYLGIGAGAHGKRSYRDADGALQIRRSRKPSQPRLYQGDPRAIEWVPVTGDERIAEFLMNALRLVDGTARDRFTETTGLPAARLQPVWDRLADQGLLQHDRIAATPLGYRHLDGVLQQFL